MGGAELEQTLHEKTQDLGLVQSERSLGGSPSQEKETEAAGKAKSSPTLVAWPLAGRQGVLVGIKGSGPNN